MTGGTACGVTCGATGADPILRTSKPTAIAMSRTIAAARNRPRTLNHVKIFGFRVVDDNRGGRLFGVELEFFAERDPDAFRIEQREELGLIFQVRAGRVAE